MIRVLVVLLIAAIGLSCALAVDRLRIQLSASEEKIEQMNLVIADRDADLAAERAWSASRETVLEAMVAIRKDMEGVRITLRDQDRSQRKALQELIQNDKQVRDYMQLAVPAALGMQYVRTQTTDPEKWRSGTGVQPSSVPAAGTGTTKK